MSFISTKLRYIELKVKESHLKILIQKYFYLFFVKYDDLKKYQPKYGCLLPPVLLLHSFKDSMPGKISRKTHTSQYVEDEIDKSSRNIGMFTTV